MATLQELQNIEPLVEQAAGYILSSSFGYTNVYTTMNEDVNAGYPRIDVECIKGEPTGHKFVSGSNQFYDHSYNALLRAYIVSDRAETTVSEHRGIVRNVTTALGDNINYISASSMSRHYMFKSDYSNQAYQRIDEPSDGSTYDETAVTFEQVVIIKPQFFP